MSCVCMLQSVMQRFLQCVLQYVLYCVAVCCSEFQCVSACCSMCCSVRSVLRLHVHTHIHALHIFSFRTEFLMCCIHTRAGALLLQDIATHYKAVQNIATHCKTHYIHTASGSSFAATHYGVALFGRID